MKTVSVRDLRYDFPKVEAMLLSGEEIRITKRRKVIARLTAEPARTRVLPDFMAQMREVFGDKVLKVSGAQIISEDRDG